MSEQKKVDFIIVGQGLAGSLLAYFLKEKGQSVLIIDDNPKSSSSKIAAGIINPITGRRFVKSWMFDELLAFNKIFYKKIEKEFEVKLFSKRSVLRFLQKNKDLNEWHIRIAFEGYGKYMKTNADANFLKSKINEPLAFGEIDHAAQVNMPLLIETFKNNFLNKRILKTENLDYKQVELKNESITYNDFEAKKVIFCEGQKGRFNPFFNYLPFEVSKGEILIVRIPELKSEKIIKDRLIIAPLGDDLYWCGSNYEWNSSDESPTDTIRVELIKKLKQTLKVDFEIVDHLAAIRPTVKDRRPFLGIHPRFPQLSIFNGLGTKGASLGPYWADHFSDFLVEDIALSEEVNIDRFV
jgi:glycine oxidase